MTSYALEWRFDLSDPRLKVAVLLAVFLVIGTSVLGINKTPAQIGFIVLIGCGLDMLLHFWLRDRTRLLFPLSALITCLGLSVLTQFAHTVWLGAIPIFLAISSKYLVTANNRHVFNPGMFGLVLSLLLSEGLISPAPVSQWGGEVLMLLFFVMTALSLFVVNIARMQLTLYFLGFYAIQLLIRSYFLPSDIPPATLIDGVLRSPGFYLFTYFMITDPRTSPDSLAGQRNMALIVVLFDLLFHSLQFTFSLFYAGFAYFSLRWLYLHWQLGLKTAPKRILGKWKAVLAIGILACAGGLFYRYLEPVSQPLDVQFSLEEMPLEGVGISARKGDLLDKVDPRIQHVAKWFYSLGDAVAVADINADGLQDMFLTLPLKAAEDRAQLYINKGDFSFDRFPISALDNLRTQPERYGTPMDALWFDKDNDGDQDLLIVVYGGAPVLLENLLKDSGQLQFADVSAEQGFNRYFNSATANILDINRDGWLDVIIGGTLASEMQDYDPVKYLNLLALPEARDEQDRRPLNVMRRNSFNARNGGENRIYINTGAGFSEQENADWGIVDERRWTLDIGTGDVNNDGWPDLYIANTAGPDKLLLNHLGASFIKIAGRTRRQIGRDTYRGMNASFADLNADGLQDIYVSNMHKPELPEGSMLWMNRGNIQLDQAAALVDRAFRANAFNRGRFGWGAALGDMDLDGSVDILQMNGWLDAAYDSENPASCPSYVYKMFQIEATPPDTHGYADNWPDMRGACMYPAEPKRLLLNDGSAHFTDVAATAGWAADDNAKAAALADFDNDGDLDVVVTRMTAPPSVYQNRQMRELYWLGFSLAGNGESCNRNGLGTVVELHYSLAGQSRTQMRYLQASNGLSAQSDGRVVFGFGAQQPDNLKVEIHWCGEAIARHYDDLAINRYQTIQQ